MTAKDCLSTHDGEVRFNYFLAADHLSLKSVGYIAGVAIGVATGEISPDYLKSRVLGNIKPSERRAIEKAWKEHPCSER